MYRLANMFLNTMKADSLEMLDLSPFLWLRPKKEYLIRTLQLHPGSHNQLGTKKTKMIFSKIWSVTFLIISFQHIRKKACYLPLLLLTRVGKMT